MSSVLRAALQRNLSRPVTTPILSHPLRSRTFTTPSKSSLRPTLPLSPPHASLTRQIHSSPISKLPEVRYVKFGESPGGPQKQWHDPRHWDTRTRLLVAVGVLGGGYYVYHLEQVEETGRWRFIDMSPEAEKKLGLETDAEVFQQYGKAFLPQNDPITQRVARIANRIITAADLGHVKGVGSAAAPSVSPSIAWNPVPEEDAFEWKGGVGAGSSTTVASEKKKSDVKNRLKQEWEVYVIKDDKTPNAFVTGGGKIFVFTGIIPIAKTDDGIATVLGHEIAHQVERHVAEKVSGIKVFSALVLILEVLGIDIGLSRLGLTLLMTLPNSRTAENEADSVGLRLMAQACYDPRESVGLWERMSQVEREQGNWLSSFLTTGSGDFLSTHPSNQKRINSLQQRIPAALQVRESSSCSMGGGETVGDFLDTFMVRLGDRNNGKWV